MYISFHFFSSFYLYISMMSRSLPDSFKMIVLLWFSYRQKTSTNIHIFSLSLVKIKPTNHIRMASGNVFIFLLYLVNALSNHLNSMFIDAKVINFFLSIRTIHPTYRAMISILNDPLDISHPNRKRKWAEKPIR